MKILIMKLKSLISVIILSNKYFYSIKLIIGFIFIIIILTTSSIILYSKKYYNFYYNWPGLIKLISPPVAIINNAAATATNLKNIKLIELNNNNNINNYNYNYNIIIQRKLKNFNNDNNNINNSKNNNNNNNNININNNSSVLKGDYEDYSDESDITDLGHGNYVGAPCNTTCNHQLKHVICDQITRKCRCKKKYPAAISPTEGCTQAKQLGEQCHYHVSCQFNDDNSVCAQVKYKAVCQCIEGFHSVSYSKKGSFCTHDISKISSDLPTLFGVGAGIAVLAGLICMVLHLFSKTKYPRHRRLNGINSTPPVMYSSTTGIPLTVQFDRPTSRQSFYSSNHSSKSSRYRRSSSAPHNRYNSSRDILITTSFAGSRRPSLTSIYSQQSSSARSYSAIRFEKEIQQKEIREEMKMHFSRLQKEHAVRREQPSTSQTYVVPNLQPRIFTSAPTSPINDTPDDDINSIQSIPICLNITNDNDDSYK